MLRFDFVNIVVIVNGFEKRGRLVWLMFFRCSYCVHIFLGFWEV